MLWHFHLVINILLICFAAAYYFSPIRLTGLKDAEGGKQEVHSDVCLHSFWLHSEDG